MVGCMSKFVVIAKMHVGFLREHLSNYFENPSVDSEGNVSTSNKKLHIEVGGVKFRIGHRKLFIAHLSKYKCCICGDEASDVIFTVDRYYNKKFLSDIDHNMFEYNGLEFYFYKHLPNTLKTEHKDVHFLTKKGNFLTVDHTHPVSKGGSNKLDNLTCMCGKCNVAKGDSFE